MTQHKFFISHSHDDNKITELLANLFKKITLNQIAPWYSSDKSASGGISMGEMWFAEIIKQIEESNVLIPIVTPNSINRPWLYFESGIAQSIKTCLIIPVCIGIGRDQIYPPLSQYQTFQLSDYRSFKEFIEKILNKYGVTFDEDFAKAQIEKTISELSKIKFEDIYNDPKTNELIKDLKNHIDKRFVDIWERPNVHITDTNLTDSVLNIVHDNKKSFSSYTISLDIRLKDFEAKQIFEIRESDTFTDTLTSIFFTINEYVKPYSYLINWVLREKKTKKLIIIKEIGNFIPAKVIFKPDIDLELISLSNPYTATESIERIKP